MGEGGENPITIVSAVLTYFSYAVLILFGQLRDFFGKLTGITRYRTSLVQKKGEAPLCASFDNFYTRRLYHRIQDAFNRPFTGPPGAHIKVIDRVTTDGVKYSVTEEKTSKNCLNLGSYNYLGFADDWNSTCKKPVVNAFSKYNVGTCSTRAGLGTHKLHKKLERIVANFVGKEAAFVFNMGYGTNSTVIPALMGKGSLIVSDSLNHTSIVNGARASGAKIQVFSHNNAVELEAILREAIIEGQPRTHRPWKKILVMIEGIYSMEGEIADLPAILAVTKKYNCYLYVDEAHSIGALGKTGRGICEYHDVDPSEIDILMGTFTKSFGGMGGYIASSSAFINELRHVSSGSLFSTAMSPIICQQIITAFDIIEGRDGTDIGAKKLKAIYDNSNFFREGLIKMGCEVLGDVGSPVIPLMLYHPSKIACFSREAKKRGLAVVVVGFPATPVVLSRARFCISAGHKRKDLEEALEKIKEIADLLKVRYRLNHFG